MFDAKPSTWLGAGYNSDAAAHTLTLNTNTAPANKTLIKVEDSEANKTTGDVRVLFYALCEQMFLAQQSQAEADRPNRMKIMRRIIGDGQGNIKRQYSFSFSMNIDGDLIVADE